MPFQLNPSQVESLVRFVDSRVRRDGCDHTHRFVQEWSRLQAVDWDDLLDLLEAKGAFCDCEVVMNLPIGIDLQAPVATEARTRANPWLLPPDFESSESAVFTKVIVCRAEIGRNTHATDGELLVPAPSGAKSRRRVRKSVNFFIGCQSGLPTEIGAVRERDAISAGDFARIVASSGFEELAPFTSREAAFVLSRVALLQPAMFVGTHYADIVDIASKHQELKVHRVFMRQS